MQTTAAEPEVRTLTITREIRIEAPIEVAFEALLEEIGPSSQMPDGKPFPMVIEPRPGGRWYRDLGSDAGHFWGHVQVIKPPTLLELSGPMFMSFPGLNHIQYRLTQDDDGVLLKLTHQAMGPLPDQVFRGLGVGWNFRIGRIAEIAAGKVRA